MRNKQLLTALAAAGIVLTIGSTAVSAKQLNYVVGDPKNRDSVSFTSDAPIELIVGKTSNISGKVSIDESLDLSKPFTATFDVDLATIDTGIPLRNEHMRDNFLETKKFPKATFTVKSQPGVTGILKDKQKVTIKATGDFALHGVTVKKTVPVDLTFFKNCETTQSKFEHCDLIQIKSTFNIPFKDHQIKRPEVVFQKLADTVIVTISATAKRDLQKP
ncbi:MAG TPA: YceI family protein [Candidatus Melainabacteria bacterium]|jgi:polyisoprenoid-binding protein YceI|nr:YceI family protein [Candidatus Melainabacteria bacterium]HIN63278.1 YceI family protein [Candidatus Obscuribacterales bacterium]